MTAWMLLALLADEGGVNVHSGETLFAQGTSINLSYLYVRAGRRSEHWGLLGATYGLSERFNLSLVVPYLSVGEDGEGDAGIADVSALAKYRFLFDGGERWEATAAAIFGVQLPTGSTEPDLDPELRLGSGSWDAFGGAAATYEWDRFEVRGHALYQLNTEGEDEFKHEDILTVGAGASWRPIVEKYPGSELGFSVGLTYQRFFDARDADGRVPGSGGDLLTSTLGAFFSPRTGIKFNASVELPLAQDREEELDYRMTFGGSYVF